MNKNQKIAMWVAIAVIVLMGLFPPWLTELANRQYFIQGYYFILDPPFYSRIYFTQLLIQWFVVALIASGTVLTLKGKAKKKKST